MAAIFVVGLGGCASGGDGSSRPVPSAADSPVVVVHAYLAAAKAEDCAFTRELTQPKSTWSWCRDPRLLDYRAIGQAVFVPAAEAGVDEQCVPFEMDTHGSSDGSMPIGWQPWELCLVQTSAGWRVHDQGQG